MLNISSGRRLLLTATILDGTSLREIMQNSGRHFVRNLCTVHNHKILTYGRCCVGTIDVISAGRLLRVRFRDGVDRLMVLRTAVMKMM